MNELALFAGAGGGLLATKWLLGWRTACYVENDLYRVEVLKARIRDGLLDDAPIWSDARTFDGRPWRGCVDIITAGFPCQPFSVAGKMEADDDPRNLWPDTIRIIGEVRPEWCLLENTPGLLSGSHGYFGQILRELAESGYDACWRVLSAAEVGAPHKRDRVWIVAHSSIEGGRAIQQPGQRSGFVSGGEDVADPDEGRGKRTQHEIRPGGNVAELCSEAVADPDSTRQLQSQGDVGQKRGRSGNSNQAVPHTMQQGSSQREAEGIIPNMATIERCGWWEVEPRLGRVVDGMADRVERIKALGDGQVPAVVRIVWELILGS